MKMKTRLVHESNKFHALPLNLTFVKHLNFNGLVNKPKTWPLGLMNKSDGIKYFKINPIPKFDLKRYPKIEC